MDKTPHDQDRSPPISRRGHRNGGHRSSRRAGNSPWRFDRQRTGADRQCLARTCSRTSIDPNDWPHQRKPAGAWARDIPDFDLLPGRNRDALREVTRKYVEAGVRVIDTSPLYGTGEVSVGGFLSAMGVTDQMFISNKIWSTGEYLADESHALASMEQSRLRLWRDKIDVLHCHSLVNIDAIVPLLRAWKKEGRIRYVGASVHENDYHHILAGLIDRDLVDFIQVNYSIFNRNAEERILRAAMDKGIGVLTNMPLEKGRLHKIVEGRPLPDFARDIGVENWAQYFIKWAMGHPAITTVLAATSNPDHAAENVGALRGVQPDQSMRQRMLRHMEGIAGFANLASMQWYPDKQSMYQGVIRRSQAALRQRMS